MSEEIEIIGRDELRRLKQELQDLKEYGGEVIGEYEKQKEELQQRIDKAIKYIEQEKKKDEEDIFVDLYLEKYEEDLLEILKGE